MHQRVVTDPPDDPNGNPVQGEIVDTLLGACRFRKSKAGNEVITTDGTAVQFNYEISAALNFPALQIGTTVQGKDGGSTFFEGRVIGYSKNQKGVKVWV